VKTKKQLGGFIRPKRKKNTVGIQRFLKKIRWKDERGYNWRHLKLDGRERKSAGGKSDLLGCTRQKLTPASDGRGGQNSRPS